MSDSPAHAPAPADPHASGEAYAAPHDHSEMHVKFYVGTGALLVFLTFFTVALSYVDLDHVIGRLVGGSHWNMIIGMIVASFKVGLVMGIFMHLKGEKDTVWRFLYFTAFFALGLFLLTAFAILDPIYGTLHTHH